MSYQVLARKWRPQTFTELVGQDHISQTLINALKSDRLPHALLFCGPRGTGKTSSARILAKSLRCPNAKDFVACHACPECSDIADGRSLNVIEIDGASNNGVDAVRELRETVGYMPSSGRYKMYIIDEVHMLSNSAFNALLKTLEEPPAHVIFVLATTEAQKIPATILSRCQRFDFRRIPTRAIFEHLKKISLQEKIQTEDESLWLIARQADGSMRDGQSLLDQVTSFSAGKITEAKVIEILGLTDRGLLRDTLDGLALRDAKKILAVLKNVMQSGLDAKVLVQDLLNELRHLLLAKMISEKNAQAWIDLADSEIEYLKNLAKNLSEEEIHFLFDMALKGSQDLFRAQDPLLVLEMLLLRMVSAPRIESLQNLSASKATTVPSPTIAAAATATPPPPVTPSTPRVVQNMAPQAPAQRTASGENWNQFVESLKKANALIGAKLENSHLVKIENKHVTVGIPNKLKFLHDQLSAPEMVKKIQNFLNTFWGSGYTLGIVLNDAMSETSTNAVNEKKAQQKKDEIQQEVEKHPLVQLAKNVLQSEVQSIKSLGSKEQT